MCISTSPGGGSPGSACELPRPQDDDDDDGDGDGDDDDDDVMMMMMMMTLMTRTKFRPGINKFYQPNSGLRGSKRWDEAIYIYTYNCYYIIFFNASCTCMR